MLVKRFTFKRNHDKGGFPWTAQSEIERPGFYWGFTAVGKRLADVKEFAARCAGVSGRACWNACRKCTHPASRSECKPHGAAIGFRLGESRNNRVSRLPRTMRTASHFPPYVIIGVRTHPLPWH